MVTNDHNPKMIASDSKAWDEEWTSRETNAEGRILLKALSQLNLVVVNTFGKRKIRVFDICHIYERYFSQGSSDICQ